MAVEHDGTALVCLKAKDVVLRSSEELRTLEDLAKL
jgi:hypothetical protein